MILAMNFLKGMRRKSGIRAFVLVSLLMLGFLAVFQFQIESVEADVGLWSPAQSEDDGYEKGDASGIYWDASVARVYWRRYSSSSGQYWAFFRFDGVTIPQGSNVTAVRVDFYLDSTSYDDIQANITGVAEDDCNHVNGTANYRIVDRSLTTNRTYLNQAGIGIGWWNVTLNAGIVWEVVHRGGWSSGNAIGLIIVGCSGGTLNWRCESYDKVGGHPAVLKVTWTPPPVDSTPPTFSSIAYSQNVTNRVTNFSVVVTDVSSYVNQAIFGWNASGSWVNRTVYSFPNNTSSEMYNRTETLPHAGIRFGFRFYASDSCNNWGSSVITYVTVRLEVCLLFNSSRGYLYVNGTSTVNGTTVRYANNTRLEFMTVPINGSFHFANYTWVLNQTSDSGSSLVNRYNLTLINKNYNVTSFLLVVSSESGMEDWFYLAVLISFGSMFSFLVWFRRRESSRR